MKEGSSCKARFLSSGGGIVLSSLAYAPFSPPNSSLHHQIESKTGLIANLVRILKAICSVPSGFLNAFSLFHNWVNIIEIRDGPSFASEERRFITLTPRKKVSFAFSSIY